MARSVRDVIRPKLVLFLVAVLAALGVRAYLSANQSIFPAISLSRVEVFADAGDLPPERVRASVARPLEAALQGLPAVRATRSAATQGALEIEIDFDPATDPGHDLQLVDDAVEGVRSELGAVRSISTLIENPNMEPVVSYAFSGDGVGQARLQHEIERALVPVFTGTPGLGRMTAFGGAPLEYEVVLNARSLARHGVKAETVGDAIGAATGAGTAGTVDKRDRRYIVLTGPPLESSGDVRRAARSGHARQCRFPWRILGCARHRRLPGDVAGQPRRSPCRALQRVSAGRSRRRRAQARGRGAAGRACSMTSCPPACTRFAIGTQTRLIVASQASLRDAILLGALLALAVIYFLLRSRAMTRSSALIVPLAMMLSVLGDHAPSGLSLNLMTVGGLAVAVGLVIDEVIVVVGAIARRGAAREGTARIKRALVRVDRRERRRLLAALRLPGGIPGFFFCALALDALDRDAGFRSRLSLFVAPLVRRDAARRASVHDARGSLDAWRRGMPARPGLDPETPRGSLTPARWLICVVIDGRVRAHAQRLSARARRGRVRKEQTLPPGTTLAATDATATALERAIVATPDVAHVGRLTGVDTNGYLPTPPNAGTLRVSLAPGSHAAFDEISDKLRDDLQKLAPGATFEFHQLLEDQINDLQGAPEAVQLSVYGGYDQQQLIAIASHLSDGLSKIQGVVDPFDGVAYGAESREPRSIRTRRRRGCGWAARSLRRFRTAPRSCPCACASTARRYASRRELPAARATCSRRTARACCA